MSTSGKLYLLPVPVSEGTVEQYIPQYNLDVIKDLTNFVAEDARNARRFLKMCGYPEISRAQIILLNEHTKNTEVKEMLNELLAGQDVGLMSDAGCPGIADPGAEVISLAHRHNIRVVPLAGPSAIVMAIMASGFNGQNFAFVGYLPIDNAQKIKRIKELEQLAGKGKQAQFFIETPYRNDKMLEDLLQSLSPATLLFIGKDITSQGEMLVSKRVAEWKKGARPNLHKVPVVFGIFQ